LKTFFIKKILG